LSTHVNPPWKSFLQFVVIAALGWAGYEFLWVRKIFAGGSSGDTLTRDQRDAIHDRITTLYQSDGCFQSLRGSVNWRPRDNFYRVEIIVQDGCEERARELCRELANLLEREWQVMSSVWAYDGTGRQLASFVR
jgi:hypothetical protein